MAPCRGNACRSDPSSARCLASAVAVLALVLAPSLDASTITRKPPFSADIDSEAYARRELAPSYGWSQKEGDVIFLTERGRTQELDVSSTLFTPRSEDPGIPAAYAIVVANRTGQPRCLRGKAVFRGKPRDHATENGDVLLHPGQAQVLMRSTFEREGGVPTAYLYSVTWAPDLSRKGSECAGTAPTGLQAWFDEATLRPFEEWRFANLPPARGFDLQGRVPEVGSVQHLTWCTAVNAHSTRLDQWLNPHGARGSVTFTYIESRWMAQLTKEAFDDARASALLDAVERDVRRRVPTLAKAYSAAATRVDADSALEALNRLFRSHCPESEDAMREALGGNG